MESQHWGVDNWRLGTQHEAANSDLLANERNMDSAFTEEPLKRILHYRDQLNHFV